MPAWKKKTHIWAKKEKKKKKNIVPPICICIEIHLEQICSFWKQYIRIQS